MDDFVYQTAFSRSVGWVTREEQQQLRSTRVAIAGLGGVGGRYVETMVRLGVGKLTICDPDRFELGNFNRQAGASIDTIGTEKCAVAVAVARGINPEIEIRAHARGVDHDNIDEFIGDADLYLDGLDFFEIPMRRLVYQRCRERGIPAICAAPVGMGVSLLHFRPGSMSFEDYFRFEGVDHGEQLLRFAAGLSPAMLSRAYLADPSAVDFAARKVPSTGMACELCAGMVGTEVLKSVLGRGTITLAPRSLHFDAYRQVMRRTWRPFGNAHPLQRILIAVMRRMVNRPLASVVAPPVDA